MYLYTGFRWIGTNDGDMADIGDAVAAWVYKRDQWNKDDHYLFSEMLYQLINTKDIFQTHVEHLKKRMMEYYGYRWVLNATMHPKYIYNGEAYLGGIHNKLEIMNRKLSQHGWTMGAEFIVDDTFIPKPKLQWVRHIGSVPDPMTITGQIEAVADVKSILSRMRKKRIEKSLVET
jgi:hypothetical protein